VEEIGFRGSRFRVPGLVLFGFGFWFWCWFTLVTSSTAFAQSLHSCVVVIDNGVAGRWVGSAEECATRLSPASTYKIPHALIGLETGVITTSTVEKWDGTKYADQKKWNQDQTVLSAMKPSVLWFFQRMAPKIGAARAHEWLQRFAYGNADTTGDITRYWINGTLRVSPDEQVAFLKKFYDGTLPVSKAHVEALQASMEQAPGTVENARGVATLDVVWRKAATLNSKTGATTIQAGLSVSWLVGRLTVDARQIVFASAVWKPNGVDNLAAAHLAVKTFVDRGILARRLPER
jgi:beta-lactamase class D